MNMLTLSYFYLKSMIFQKKKCTYIEEMRKYFLEIRTTNMIFFISHLAAQMENDVIHHEIGINLTFFD